MTFIDLLALPIARFILIPITTCIINSLINYTSQNDNIRSFSIQLCNWGTSLVTTNILLIVTDVGSKAQYGFVDKSYLSNVLVSFWITMFIIVFSL